MSRKKAEAESGISSTPAEIIITSLFKDQPRFIKLQDFHPEKPNTDWFHFHGEIFDPVNVLSPFPVGANQLPDTLTPSPGLAVSEP